MDVCRYIDGCLSLYRRMFVKKKIKITATNAYHLCFSTYLRRYIDGCLSLYRWMCVKKKIIQEHKRMARGSHFLWIFP
jgi:hypothetical protein